MWLWLALLLCGGLATAQTQHGAASSKSRKPAPAVRSECLSSGLCVSIPARWKRIGDVFDGLGFVAAEPHAGADRATWPQLTVAAFQPPKVDSAAPSLDTLVDRMLAPEGALASAETLERSRLLLNGSPAEIVRVEFRDDAGNPTAIEEVALIEGDGGMIYSIGLHCAPGDFARLAPVFQQATWSWRIRSAAAPPHRTQPRQAHPKQNSAKP
jgi:hypothetical protein